MSQRHTVNDLITKLKGEYLNLNDKIARASFALSTLDFDDKEHELLSQQIQLEVKLMNIIEERAQYAAKGENNAN